MKKKKIILLGVVTTVIVCGASLFVIQEVHKSKSGDIENKSNGRRKGKDEDAMDINPVNEITELEEGLSTVLFNDTYAFDKFIEHGGASSDAQVVAFLTNEVMSGNLDISFGDMLFGCSTISVKSPNGEQLFGRNFDWNKANAMIVESHPQNDYASISTVNMDFINGSVNLDHYPDVVQSIVAMYAPMDGMNEKGLAISVNMIQDSSTIEQNTNKPDLTTTTAIRLILNKASTVQEALDLLQKYDVHASMGMMIHFAISDKTGRSVVVEYINNEMVVTDTPVVTNFYITEGEKFGIGTKQSHTRYEMLLDLLDTHQTLDMQGVRDALESVSKKNFGEFESTEWSIVFNQETGEVRYYHRENYKKSYIFQLASDKEN